MFARKIGLRAFSNSINKRYYEILGIKPTATQEDIKSAYYTLTKRFHPDRNQGNPNAASRFLEITQAYEVLSNQSLRSQYDQGTLDVSNIPVHKNVSEIKVEEIFRDRGSSYTHRAQPSSADYDKWLKTHYSRQRKDDYATRQNVQAKRAREGETNFFLGVEIMILGLVIGSIVFLMNHPESGKPPKK